MKAIVSIFVIVGILGATLEGAADVATFADPCRDGGAVVHDDAIDLPAEASSGSDAEDDCAVCTPLCHCAAHGSALIVDGSNDISAAPSAAPAHVQVRHTSFVEPPFLPPPIL